MEDSNKKQLADLEALKKEKDDLNNQIIKLQGGQYLQYC